MSNNILKLIIILGKKKYNDKEMWKYKKHKNNILKLYFVADTSDTVVIGPLV